MSGREHTTVMIRKETKPLFYQAKEAAAVELGEQPTNADVVEELCRAYVGRDACGRWQE